MCLNRKQNSSISIWRSTDSARPRTTERVRQQIEKQEPAKRADSFISRREHLPDRQHEQRNRMLHECIDDPTVLAEVLWEVRRGMQELAAVAQTVAETVRSQG